MKTDLFQSCGHCWVFQICWHVKYSIFTASSLRIWNSSTEIPSPPLALFMVMLLKAHLTSHSRMSGSKWVITPSWLSGSWRYFLCSSSVYFSHLFLVYSALLNHTIPKTQSDLEKKEQSLRPWLLISNILESYSNQNRMIFFWHENRDIDQQSRTAKLERNAHPYIVG